VNVGDIVKRKLWTNIEYSPAKCKTAIGIIVETGVYVGRKDTKVMWPHGINTEQSNKLEVVSESR